MFVLYCFFFFREEGGLGEVKECSGVGDVCRREVLDEGGAFGKLRVPIKVFLWGGGARNIL